MSNGVPTVEPSALRAVVASDVNDERVIQLAQVLHLLDDPADFVIGVGRIRGKDFSLADEQFLLIGGERIPLRQDCPAMA